MMVPYGTWLSEGQVVMEEEPATGRTASGGDTEEGMGSERERGVHVGEIFPQMAD